MIFANPNDPAVGTFVPTRPTLGDGSYALGARCTGKFCWPLPDKGLRKRIHRVSAPTLVLWGKQDHLVPAAYAHEFVKLIKGAKVELIDKASHMLPIEQPAAAAKAVADFVKR